MPLLIQGNGGVAAEVDGLAHRALRITPKPIDWGSLGHYHTSHRHAIVASQAANSRLFELRNSSAGSTLLIPTRIRIQWLQTGAHTAAIEDSLDLYKVTGFSAVDTTNTVTPVLSVMRGATMTAVGSAAGVPRGVTVAGAAAGMTGGTLTKDTAPFAQLPQFLLAAAPTGSTIIPQVLDYQFNTSDGEHPFVLAGNEGIMIENRVLLGAAAGSAVYIDVSWAETTSY